LPGSLPVLPQLSYPFEKERACQKRRRTGNSASCPGFRRYFSGGDMDEFAGVRHFRWDRMEKEKVTDVIHRKVISGERAMVAQIFLEKGARVPMHSHENEQITYLLEGALRFWIGETREEMVLRAGEVLHIPSNVSHEAEALEDCLDVDVFSPPRQDWLDGTDDYFRK